MAPDSRPLSPHLTVYRWQITLTMSILHRITGTGLYLAFAIFVWWLAAAAWSPGALELFNTLLGHWIGKIVQFGLVWALFHHMLGGIRHFIWDTGNGFSERARFGLAWFNLFGGLALTVLAFFFMMAA